MEQPLVDPVDDVWYHIYERILAHGETVEPEKDRTGVGYKAITGMTITFEPRQYSPTQFSFPIPRGRRFGVYTWAGEIAWMISGDTTREGLNRKGSKVWDAWIPEGGDGGPIYGFHWRRQLPQIVEAIKRGEVSRRFVVDSFQVSFLEEMVLPPCHFAFQLIVRNESLDIVVSQRSMDTPIGGPYNLMGYTFLLLIVAKEVGKRPGKVIINVGDAHIYLNQIPSVLEYMDIVEDSEADIHPTIIEIDNLPEIQDTQGWLDLDLDALRQRVKLLNYISYPAIQIPVAV